MVNRGRRKAWYSESKASQTEEDEGKSELHTVSHGVRLSNCVYGGRK